MQHCIEMSGELFYINLISKVYRTNEIIGDNAIEMTQKDDEDVSLEEIFLQIINFGGNLLIS